MAKTLYLRKANDKYISHCHCGDGRITWPPQMDCPWCGCGWLFTCVGCRKAFTFATAVYVEQSMEELAAADLAKWSKPPTDDDIADWVQGMNVILKDIKPGKEYVIFDGLVIPTDQEEVVFEGWHSKHDLSFVPQVRALEDETIGKELLTDIHYWQATRLDEPES